MLHVASCALFGESRVSVTQHFHVLGWNLLATNLLALKFCISEVRRWKRLTMKKQAEQKYGKKNKHSLTLKSDSLLTHTKKETLHST